MTFDPLSDQLRRQYEKTSQAGGKIDEFQRASAAERSQFFEKLALMNGGAIVLSVTFLGYFLSNQHVLRWRHLLHVAWALLLLSLLACLLRNLFYQNYVFYARVSPYVRKLAEQSELEAQVALDPTAVLLADSEDALMTTEEREQFATHLRKKGNQQQTEAEAAIRKSKRAERIWRACEPVALSALFLGVALLVLFATLNT
jgi:hypothetical protein